MRWAVFSDIHANFPALKAVKDHLKAKKIQIHHFVFTGDVVGYGPHPNECIDDLYNNVMLEDGWKKYSVAGNSDLAALQNTWRQIATHNEARQTLQWTSEKLTEKNRQRLETLPRQALEFPKLYTFVHATIDDPTGVITGAYMDLAGGLNFDDAAQLLKTPLAIYGHTHRSRITCVDLSKGSATLGFSQIPIKVEYSSKDPTKTGEYVYAYGNDTSKGYKVFICVGSIGQPRDDGDPRAAYGILDDEAQTVTFYRVPYRIDDTVKDLDKLPIETIEKPTIQNLITRLKTGI